MIIRNRTALHVQVQRPILVFCAGTDGSIGVQDPQTHYFNCPSTSLFFLLSEATLSFMKNNYRRFLVGCDNLVLLPILPRTPTCMSVG